MEKNKSETVSQTLNLFLILAFLTILFVLGIRAVLFAPTDESGKPLYQSTIQAEKTVSP